MSGDSSQGEFERAHGISFHELTDHSAKIKFLQDVDWDNVSTPDAFKAFGYLKDHVLEKASTKGHIESSTYKHPKYGRFNKPCLDEQHYQAEITLMKKIQSKLQYSSALQSTIDKIIDETLSELEKEPAFIKALKNWNTLSEDEIIQNAYGVLYVCTDVAKKYLDVPLTEVGVFVIDDKDYPDMAAYTPISDENAKLEEAHLLCQRSSLKNYDPENFIALLLHEKIHNLIGHLGYYYNQGDLAQSHQDDGQLSYLRQLHGTGLISPISSLYFTDCEESLCYEQTDKASNRIERIIEDLPKSTSEQSQYQRPTLE